MIFSYDKHQDVFNAYLKFNNRKVKDADNKERFIEQIKLAVKRIASQHIYPKLNTDDVDVYYDYEGNDFVKGKMTLRLRFKILKNEE